MDPDLTPLLDTPWELLDDESEPAPLDEQLELFVTIAADECCPF